MTKVIIISGGNLDSYYEQIQEYLYAKYHSYPTKLEVSKGSWNIETQNCDRPEINGKQIIPIGKRVV